MAVLLFKYNNMISMSLYLNKPVIMKSIVTTWAKGSFLFILCALFTATGLAQSTKKERQAKKAAEIKAMVDGQHYIFVAEFVQPQRGGDHYLTSSYDLRVTKDSLIAYLPYFGRAYVAPINPDDAGMNFTATNFEYNAVNSKNGWEIAIKPKDTKDVRSLQISISKDGYANLHINSTNRDAIGYQGHIEGKKEKAK